MAVHLDEDNTPALFRTTGGYRIRLRVMGEMAALDLAGDSVLPRNRKTRALLAILALSLPGPLLRSRLAGLLWSTRATEQARMSLRQAVHELGTALSAAGGGILQATRGHLSLRPGTVWVDAQAATKAVPPIQALNLLDGELLEDLRNLDPAFDAWREAENARLRSCARALADSIVATASPADAVAAAEHLLAVDPAHEAAWQVVIRCHLLRGDRSLALAALDRARLTLVPLGGLSPQTEALIEDVRATTRRDVVSVPATARSAQGYGARVGVPPLTVIGGAADDHLSLGLAEEITTALSRFRWLPLVSTGSLARMAGRAHETSILREEFGLDFVLDGTVQRATDRVRITLRLLDLNAEGEMVWARRFDRPADDILTLQDEIAAEVVAQVDPELLLVEARRAASRPATSTSAYDLLLRAIPLMYRLEQASFAEAGDLLREATRIEPEYAAAQAWRAYWHVFLVGQNWAADPADALEQAALCADRAIRLDAADARALTIAGHVRAFLHRQPQEAAVLHGRALTLNPNLPMAWVFSGVALAYLGRHAEALARMERYKRLSPLDPHAFFFDGTMMLPTLLTGAYANAAQIGRQVVGLHPGLSAAYKPYLAALGHLGSFEEAARVRDRLLALEPDFTISSFLAATPLVRSQDRDHFAEGLRRIGLKEA